MSLDHGGTRPDRLVEYFCSVGVGDQLTPMHKDGVESPLYAMCLVYGKDEPPSGFDKLEHCWNGESANLNAGNANVFSPAIFLCISKKTGSQRGGKYIVSPFDREEKEQEGEGQTEDDENLDTPIVDVIVLSPDRGDKRPPGYYYVPVCSPHNKSSPYQKTMVLAYSRTPGRPAILNIIVCMGKPSSSSGGVLTSTSNNNIAASLSQHTTPSSVSSSTSSASGASSPLSPSPACKVAPRYTLLKKNVNMGTFHDGLYLAVLSEPSTLTSLLLKPTLVDRLPRVDLSASPLPDSLPLFCFPEGITIQESARPPPPSVSSFVLTTPNGLQLYCAMLSFWEQILVEVEEKSTAAPLLTPPRSRRMSATPPSPAYYRLNGQGHAVLSLTVCPHLRLSPMPNHFHRFAPKAIILVSYWPYYHCFTQFLVELYKIVGYSSAQSSLAMLLQSMHTTTIYPSISSATYFASPTPASIYTASATSPNNTLSPPYIHPSPIPIERYLMNLWETPLPRTSRIAVQLSVGTHSITFDRPSYSELPLADFSFVPLFYHLSIPNILIILAAMINEKKIILSSKHLPLLTPIGEALRSLIFPLEWSSPFVPIVPALSSGILGAPMPIFAGVDSHYTQNRLNYTDDVCLVKLDDDEVKLYGKVVLLPESLVSRLKKELSEYAHIDSIIEQARYSGGMGGGGGERGGEGGGGAASGSGSMAGGAAGVAGNGDRYGQDHQDGLFDYTPWNYHPPPASPPMSTSWSGEKKQLLSVEKRQELARAILMKQMHGAATISGSMVDKHPAPSTLSSYSSPAFTGASYTLSASTSSSQLSSLAGSASTSTTPAFNVLAARAAFLHLFIALLSTVDEFLLFPPVTQDKQPSFDQLFDLSSWLNSNSIRAYKAILRQLATTQLFAHYIEEKTYAAGPARKVELEFFERCCMYEREHMNMSDKQKQFHPNLLVYLSTKKPIHSIYTVPGPDMTGLDPQQKWSYPLFPQLDMSLLRKPRPVVLKYLRDATNVETPNEADELSRMRRSSSNRSTDHSPSGSSTSASTRNAAARAMPALSLSVSVSKPASPTLFAKLLLRDIYACWFELWLICLPYHPNIPEGILQVWHGLARMTKQEVLPDEGIFRSVLAICGRWKKKDAAASIFETMKKNGVKPTSVTYGAYTSALAEASNVEEEQREQRHGEAVEALSSPESTMRTSSDPFGLLSPTSHNAASSLTSTTPSTAVSTTPPRPVVHAYPSLHLLSLDPYRLAADKHARLILKAQRQQVQWHSLSMGVSHVCESCAYEMSEGEIVACWMHDHYQAPACAMCRSPFNATLRVIATIVTTPPRFKSFVFARCFHRTLHSHTRRYHITVPLLSPVLLRKEFLSASTAFRDDFINHNTFRVMHEVLYWNLIFQLSHPYNHWDLTFLVDLSPTECKKYRVKRLYRNDRGWYGELEEEDGAIATTAATAPAAAATAGSDVVASSTAPGSSSTDGGVSVLSKRKSYVRARTIQSSEGLRGRVKAAQQQMISPLSGAILSPPADESNTTSQHPHQLSKQQLRKKYRLEAEESEDDEEDESQLPPSHTQQEKQGAVPKQEQQQLQEHKEKPVVKEGWKQQQATILLSPSQSSSASAACTSPPVPQTSPSSSSTVSPPLPSPLHLTVDISASNVSPPIATPGSATLFTPPPVVTPSSTVPLMALSSIAHPEDIITEREIIRHLSKQQMFAAIVCFLKHRMKMKAQTAYAPSTQQIEENSTPTPTTYTTQKDKPVYQTQSTPVKSKSPTALLPVSSSDHAISASTPKSLLVKKSVLSSILPSRQSSNSNGDDNVHSANAIYSEETLSPKSPQGPNPALHAPGGARRSSSMSKSHSSNEVESMKSSLHSVTNLVLSGMKTGNLDHSPLTRNISGTSTAAASAAGSTSTTSDSLSSTATDGAIAGAERRWYPVRHAAPSARLHNRCMFECFAALGLKSYDNLNALIDAFTACIQSGKLHQQYVDELTAMDLAPTPTIATIEQVLGIRKSAEKKSKREREHQQAAQKAETSGKEAVGDTKKKGAAAATSNSKKLVAKNAADSDVLPDRTTSPLVKSSSSPLRTGSNSPSTSTSPASPSHSSTTITQHEVPVSVAFPIAYPVYSTPPHPHSSAAAGTKGPTPHSAPGPRSYDSDAEEVVGSISDFVGPNPDYRGQTPGTTPAHHQQRSENTSTPAKQTRRTSQHTSNHHTSDSTSSSGRESGSNSHSSSNAALPPFSPTSGPSSSVFALSPEKERDKGLKVNTAQSSTSPSSSRSSISSVETPPSRRIHTRQSSTGSQVPSSASRPKQQQQRGNAESPKQGGQKGARTTRANSSLFASTQPTATENVQEGGQMGPPPIVTSISSPTSPVTSPRSSVSTAQRPHGQPAKPHHDTSTEVTQGRANRANSQPPHPPTTAYAGGTPTTSGSGSRPSSGHAHAAPPPKSFSQTLYQFLMAKPTGAQSAAAGGPGSGSSSFTAPNTSGRSRQNSQVRRPVSSSHVDPKTHTQE